MKISHFLIGAAILVAMIRGAAAQLLVDYGSSAGSNIYNLSDFPGWNTVSLSAGTIYSPGTGISGTTLAAVPGDSSQYANYTCISGPARPFTRGQRIVLTWHNSTAADINFNPLISFSDDTNPVDLPGEPQWFIIGRTADYYVFPGDSIITFYDITDATTCGSMIPASEGIWSHVNICVNTIQPGIILDKIKIVTADTVAPDTPSGLTVTVSSEKSISLSWSAVADPAGGDGLAFYEIWEGDRLFGVSDSTSFRACLLESSASFMFRVRAVDRAGNISGFSNSVNASTQSFSWSDHLLVPSTDITYLGAFRMPAGGTNSDFGYMDTDLAFYPNGDPGSSDGFPGSLFLAGNATQRFVTEISIPQPFISAGKDVNELPQASFIQNFYDIRSVNQPVIEYSWSKGPALEYLPPQAGQSEGYIYTCFGDYYQWNGERLPSFGASRTVLSNALPEGGWFIGSGDPYSQPYYMTFITFNFSLPAGINNHLLVAGGSRPGDVHHGPTLMAYGPWNDGTPLPVNGTHLDFTPLLMYDADAGQNRLEGYSYCDAWNGGAWVAETEKRAVIISGTKGRGREWYGYDNGESTFNVMFNVPTPVEPEDHAPRQSCFEPMMLFYDPADLEAVAAGTMQPWQPQPYAIVNVSSYFYGPVNTGPTYGRKFRGGGGMAYDRQHELLYVLEQNVTGIDSTEALVHVFSINPVIGVESVAGSFAPKVTVIDGNLHIAFEENVDARIEIYNASGSCILTSTLINSRQINIPFKHAHGFYMVRISSASGCSVIKLII